CEYNASACDSDPECDKCWAGSFQGRDDDCDGIIDEDKSAMETCNGIDDDCDGAVDLADGDLDVSDAPNICNTACDTDYYEVVCNGDTDDTDEDWACEYDTSVIELSGGVVVANETLCDGLDNDCDGYADEALTMGNAEYLGEGCDNSDTSSFSQGECIVSGSWRCVDTDPTADLICCADTDGDNLCSAEVPTPTEMAAGRTESLDGADNDCDGLVDEGTNCADAVVRIDYDSDGDTDYEIFAYEATRFGADTDDAGSGNGVACSRPNAIPWTGVTLAGAEAACAALDTDDGAWAVCSAGQWQAACEMGGTAETLYPYGELYNDSYCNGIDYTPASGLELIPVGDLITCLADWGQTPNLFDMSGNAEEWTSTETSTGSGVYQIRGGSYNDQADGLSCSFDLWAANGSTFKMDNLGFRCCRGFDPDTLCASANCAAGVPTGNECDPLNATILRMYDGGSSCYGGNCYYSYVEGFCANGCVDDADGSGSGTAAGCLDMDGDGYIASGLTDTDGSFLGDGDCNDLNPDVYPMACESRSDDGYDNDCDGYADEVELMAIIRDFRGKDYDGVMDSDVEHPDFEVVLSDWGDPRNGLHTGLVLSTLTADHRPIYDTDAIYDTDPESNITSAATFDQWYLTDTDTDTPINMETSICIELTETPADSGIWVFDRRGSNSFFPIDDMLFGEYCKNEDDGDSDNECSGHNFHFTTQISTMFRYEAGQQFTFSGDDDVWVFIDGNLEMDLGGQHGEETATIIMDNLGLTEGESYRMDIFHAERHTVQSNFMVTTTIAGFEAVPQ
ncbi:MAG: fibro-slime domain-containing protein, partial [Deltaproteobacteria bacterium]|nr:fibro-slime domain-containing protein [Deltaproteobacteria bacterium]MBN2670613.1 fibro-slime domain-containing protein [Deltaproteobacteria bacterium]